MQLLLLELGHINLPAVLVYFCSFYQSWMVVVAEFQGLQT